MRILLVSIMSYPVKGGTHLRNWQNINILSQLGEVGVFSVFNRDVHPPHGLDVEIWRHFNIVKQSSIPDLVERAVRLLSRYGLRYYWAYSNQAAKALDEVVKKFRPDAIVLEELASYPFLSIIKRYNCKIIFDNHNVESHLFRQIKCERPTIADRLRFKLHFPQIKLAEADFIKQAAQTWVCSEVDQKLMNRLYKPLSPGCIIPNAIDLQAYSEVNPSNFPLPEGLDREVKNILFLGNFFYPPNREAAEWLIERVLPALKQKSTDFRLLLVGSNPSPFMKKAARREPHLIVTGEVPDVRPYLAAAGVMVVPLFKGGGTRFKILEAFAAGCPVISTTKGAEGLRATGGEHLLIADDVETMIAQIERILTNSALTRKLVEAANQLVQARYSWEIVTRRVEAALHQLQCPV